MFRITMDEKEVYVVCECGLSQVVHGISAALSWCSNEALRHGVGSHLRMEIVIAVDVAVLPGLLGGGKGPSIM